MSKRKFPIGIQTFEKIRKNGYYYIDKTDLVYKLSHDGSVYFLSRPRRFGKSLLVTTLKSYFEGRKDLFEGLAIEKLETEWEKYPVLHFDFSGAKYLDLSYLQERINLMLLKYEEIYGKNESEQKPSSRLQGIIERAEQKTGKPVVVLVDE